MEIYVRGFEKMELAKFETTPNTLPEENIRDFSEHLKYFSEHSVKYDDSVIEYIKNNSSLHPALMGALQLTPLPPHPQSQTTHF